MIDNENRNIITTTKIIDIVNKEKLGIKLKKHEYIWFDRKYGVRKSGVVFQRTQEELDEYIKSKMNIHYFAQNYCKVKLDDGKYGLIPLRPEQKEILDLYTKNRYSLLMASRQTGKCVDFNTICTIMSPDGEIFDISIGELYYNEIKKIRKLNIYEKIKIFLYKVIKYIDNF
jgi:hypothetical protein